MNRADKYLARAQHCMEMAGRTQHDEDKRSWLLLAKTWLGMITEGQQTARNDFDAAIRDEGTGLRAVNLRVVR